MTVNIKVNPEVQHKNSFFMTAVAQYRSHQVLTNYMKQSPLWKLVDTHLVKKFTDFY